MTFAATVTVQLAVLSPAFAVMTAVPALRAFTLPSATEATVASEVVQVTVLSVALSGRTVAMSVASSPSTRLSVVLSRVMEVTGSNVAVTVTEHVAVLSPAFAVIVAGGVKQTLPEELRFFSGAPGNIILAGLAFLLMFFILNYTKIGTYCNAIGSNEFTAKNMGISVKKYKLIGFILLHFFVGIMAILTVSYGTTMTALTGMSTMSRNFQPLMGTFFGVAFRKYRIPISAIVIGEFIISIIFNGFVALGAPTTIQNVVTGAALLAIVSLTARGARGSVVK